MNANKVSIKDCAEVQPGFSIKKAVRHDPKGSHQIITARHLTDGEPYTFKHEHLLRITPSRSPDNYQLATGDILFMSRGSKNISTLLESIPHPVLAPSTFYILRPKKNVLPAYLAWILNQKPVQANIGEMRTGAGTPMIPRKEFERLSVPLPSFEVQKKIVEVDSLMRKEQVLLRQLAVRKKDLATAACLQAAKIS